MIIEYNVNLEQFKGPLDLLLFLIKKTEIDIYDIPISEILDQYMEYIRMMDILDLGVAGEFVVMAATLMHIKSRMLLPKDPDPEEEIEDPRTDLVKQLLEYQKIQEAAGFLEEKEIAQKDVFRRTVDPEYYKSDENVVFDFTLFDLLQAFSDVLKKKTEKGFVREIIQEEINVEDKIADIIELLKEKSRIKFEELFEDLYTKMELVVTFLAVLELIKANEIEVSQEQTNDNQQPNNRSSIIHIRKLFNAKNHNPGSARS